MFDFGKVRQLRQKVKKLVIKNPGSIPATAILRLQKSTAFRVLETREYTLMPKEVKAFSVEFCPQSEDVFDETLQVDTLCNPYERVKIQLKGEGYFDILAFEDLEDKQDILVYEDIILHPSDLNLKPEPRRIPMKRLKDGRTIYDLTLPGESSPVLTSRDVKVRNYSENSIQFNWKDTHPLIQVKPSRGNIGGKKARTFSIRLLNQNISEFLTLSTRLQMEFEEIVYVHAERKAVSDAWDSTLRIREMLTREALKQHLLVWESENLKSKDNTIVLKGQNENGLFEVYRQLPTPDYQILRPSLDKKDSKLKKPKSGVRAITLDIKAALDVPRLECNTQEIVFLPTKMYSERVFSFSLRNHSKIKIPIICKIVKPGDFGHEHIPDSGYFSVTPSEKVLEKESDNEFIVKFQPLECNPDIDRVLMLHTPSSKP